MPFLSDRVLDFGLAALQAEATHLHILPAEPATYAAVTAGTLGSSAVSIGAPAARSAGGRRVTVPAISAGTVSSSGSASHYAVVDQANSRLLAAAALAAPQTVSGGNKFTVAAFDISIPGPA